MQEMEEHLAHKAILREPASQRAYVRQGWFAITLLRVLTPQRLLGRSFWLKAHNIQSPQIWVSIKLVSAQDRAVADAMQSIAKHESYRERLNR